MQPHIRYAPVAQLDRVSDSDSEGRAFESHRACQKPCNARLCIADCSIAELFVCFRAVRLLTGINLFFIWNTYANFTSIIQMSIRH